eukprot:3313114-Rhodomonas_salina.4
MVVNECSVAAESGSLFSGLGSHACRMLSDRHPATDSYILAQFRHNDSFQTSQQVAPPITLPILPDGVHRHGRQPIALRL